MDISIEQTHTVVAILGRGVCTIVTLWHGLSKIDKIAQLHKEQQCIFLKSLNFHPLKVLFWAKRLSD